MNDEYIEYGLGPSVEYSDYPDRSYCVDRSHYSDYSDYRDRSDYSDYSDYPGYPGYATQYDSTGTGRHRAAPVFPEPLVSPDSPLVPPDSTWDPAEELAYLLRDSMRDEYVPTAPHARDETSVTAPSPGSPMENLREITAELPPLKAIRRGHRKLRERKRPGGLRTVSYVIAALAAVIVSMVSFCGGMATYEPLRIVALSRTEGSIASWWPLLVYGPWLVASLSILRAALHQRRAVHSWFMVVLFSSVAILLCVLQAPRTITDIAAAALPSVASLACFQQLVRQIALTRPPHRTLPRHRSRTAAARPFAPATGSAPASAAKGKASPSPARPQPDNRRPPRHLP